MAPITFLPSPTSHLHTANAPPPRLTFRLTEIPLLDTQIHHTIPLQGTGLSLTHKRLTLCLGLSLKERHIRADPVWDDKGRITKVRREVYDGLREEELEGVGLNRVCEGGERRYGSNRDLGRVRILRLRMRSGLLSGWRRRNGRWMGMAREVKRVTR